MRPPCPICGNAMSQTFVPCDGHRHPLFVCLCGAEVVLHTIEIPNW